MKTFDLHKNQQRAKRIALCCLFGCVISVLGYLCFRPNLDFENEVYRYKRLAPGFYQLENGDIISEQALDKRLESMGRKKELFYAAEKFLFVLPVFLLCAIQRTAARYRKKILSIQEKKESWFRKKQLRKLMPLPTYLA